jgi:hypothetical protein
MWVRTGLREQNNLDSIADLVETEAGVVEHLAPRPMKFLAKNFSHPVL